MSYKYEKVEVPSSGSRIEKGKDNADDLIVPDDPIIPIIYGDGIGVDVGPATQQVLQAAAEATGRKISWMEVHAGESASELYDGNILPEDTLAAIREFRVAIKGPLTTPVGSGFRSLNVALRKILDLYACVRPVYHLKGVPSPVKHPEKMDMVIFRENTEDIYAGIEWEAGTPEVEKIKRFIEEEMGVKGAMHEGPIGIGIKPITEFGTKRLVKKAIDYAIERNRKSVTFVHKGNIMKYTEAAFAKWGYELAEEYGDQIIAENTLWEEREGEVPEGSVVINDRIADNMLQQVLTRTDEYDVLAVPNLNGDYLSDACAAQVGGLGIAPGANIGDGMILAEPTHGSAPKYVGQNKVNPTAMILSGRIMLEYMGWHDAADLVKDALEAQIASKEVTYDFERQMTGATKVSTTDYTEGIVKKIQDSA